MASEAVTHTQDTHAHGTHDAAHGAGSYGSLHDEAAMPTG